MSETVCNTSGRELWVNVVLRALKDALVSDVVNNSKKENSLIRQQARTWFSLSNRDFIEVCNLAGFNPKATYDKAKAAIEKHDALISAGLNPDIPKNQSAKIHKTNSASKAGG